MKSSESRFTLELTSVDRPCVRRYIVGICVITKCLIAHNPRRRVGFGWRSRLKRREDRPCTSNEKSIVEKVTEVAETDIPDPPRAEGGTGFGDGKGVGDALMRQIEDTARDEGMPMLRLETGNVLHAAHALYRRHGFVDCGVFGDYVAAKSSIFMEKPL